MENHRLYIFNPDHDLALAHGKACLGTPASARQFADEAAALPLWYADSDSEIFAEADSGWLRSMQEIFPQLRTKRFVSAGNLPKNATVFPWGWNASLRCFLQKSGVAERCLLSDENLEKIRNLSHRRNALACLEFMKNAHSVAECRSEAEVRDVLANGFPLIFKAPWSGSGKGLFLLHDAVSPSFFGWVRNVLARQGSVMAEKFYDKIQDFAMEFFCENGSARFCGYSLFSTSGRGAYGGNLLLPDEEIFRRLAQYVGEAEILRTKELVLRFLESQFADYEGFVGVDMLVFRAGSGFRIHPCVEINVRRTMGLVARQFADNFLAPHSSGMFKVEYFAEAGKLHSAFRQRQTERPPEVCDGRVVSGFLPLTPFGPQSHYGIFASVQRDEILPDA